MGFRKRGFEFHGFLFHPIRTILVFTLVSYVILFSLFPVEYWFKVILKRQPIDDALLVPKNYRREFLDQVFCVALPEEVLIRGYLPSNLLELSPVIAIVISAATFSLHPGYLLGGKARFSRTFVTAIVLGVTFIYAGLIPCVILHFIGNLIDPVVAKTILSRYSHSSFHN